MLKLATHLMKLGEDHPDLRDNLRPILDHLLKEGDRFNPTLAAQEAADAIGSDRVDRNKFDPAFGRAVRGVLKKVINLPALQHDAMEVSKHIDKALMDALKTDAVHPPPDLRDAQRAASAFVSATGHLDKYEEQESILGQAALTLFLARDMMEGIGLPRVASLIEKAARILDDKADDLQY